MISEVHIRSGIFSKLLCSLTDTSTGHNARNFSFLKRQVEKNIAMPGMWYYNIVLIKIRHTLCGMSNLSLLIKLSNKISL